MRRSLAGLLFGFASIFASLALSGFWLQYTAFSPDHTRSAAKAVLGDSEIKNEIARLIANATIASLNQAAPETFPTIDTEPVRQLVFDNLRTTEGSKLMEGVIADAHAKLIGLNDKPVQITPEQMVPLVGNQVAMNAPTIVLPVEEVPALSTMRQVLKWLVPISAGLAVVMLLLGFFAHPDKAELLRSLGILLLGMALLLVVIGYVVPTLVLPLLTKNVWIGAVPRLAADSLPFLLGLTLLLAGAGLGCLAGASASRRRDRWSQPIRRTSYREERRWS
ncbi:MAG: hypothetical protein ABIR32_00760 [Ilumatobacteraceae bacterium]